MITLAFELSASPCSLALLRDDDIAAERTWSAERSGGRHLFSHLNDLLKESGTEPERIDRYAVGLGPGSFAGLRMALTTARAMALPDSRKIYGLPSSELTARSLAARYALPSIAVVGDARRGRLWVARYTSLEPDRRVMDNPFHLTTWSELPALVEAMAAMATPHGPTLGARLKSVMPAGMRLFDQDAIPSAAMAGHWAPRFGQEDQRGNPATALAPVYLHPAIQPHCG